MTWATDRVLDYIVLMLLKSSREERVASEGTWASTIDWAMHEWSKRHPNTLPPACLYADAPRSCYTGMLPPIYEWPLDKPGKIH